MAKKDTRPARSPGPAVTYGGILALALVVGGLISAGMLPVSCGRNLPFIGQHYRQFCEACNGHGKVAKSCQDCRGRGYFGGATCTKCQGKGRLEETCPYCAGTGKKPAK